MVQQGDANGQTSLGFMYDKGQGVPQDYAEAVRWYRKAAVQGYAEAQVEPQDQGLLLRTSRPPIARRNPVVAG